MLTNRKAILASLAFLLFASCFGFAHASPLAEQLEQDTFGRSNGNDGFNYSVYLGTGFTSNLVNYITRFDIGPGGSSGSVPFTLWECPSGGDPGGGGGGGCTIKNYQPTTLLYNSGIRLTGTYAWEFNVVADPSKDYWATVLAPNSVPWTLYGTDDRIPPAVDHNNNIDNSFEGSYFQLNGNYSPDGNTNTHVIAISSPVLYATTTSPFVVDFTYHQGTPVPANGYRMQFTNTLTGAYKETTVYFDSSGSDGNFQASTTASVPWSGTTKLTISLIDGSPDVPSITPTVLSQSQPQWFGVDYNDNTQVIEFGPAFSTAYASTSCMMDWSFTFNIGDCVGYLMTPTQNVVDAYQSVPEQMKARFPFVYLGQMEQIRTTLFGNTTVGTTSITVNIRDTHFTLLSKSMVDAVPYINWIKLLLTALLYFMMAEYVYYRVLRVHDNITPK